MENNLIPVGRIIYRWRNPILWFTLAAAVISVVVSLILPVYYRSSTTFYVASPDLGKPEKLFGFTNSEIQYYGTDDDVDRVLSFSKSNILYDHLIDSFELLRYYDIPAKQASARTEARNMIKKDLEIVKNEEGAIELSFMHKKPEQAAIITKAARNYIESYMIQLTRNGQNNMMKVYEASIADKLANIRVIADTLRFIRTEYGIIDPSSQGEVLSTLLAETESNLKQAEAQYKSLSSSGAVSADTLALVEADLEGLREKWKGLISKDGSQTTSLMKYNMGLSDYLYFDQIYNTLKGDLAYEQRRIKFFKTAMATTPPGIHIIEEVVVPEKKYKPRRSVIVLGSTMAALFFSILLVLLIESYRSIPWNQLSDESA